MTHDVDSPHCTLHFPSFMKSTNTTKEVREPTTEEMMRPFKWRDVAALKDEIQSLRNQLSEAQKQLDTIERETIEKCRMKVGQLYITGNPTKWGDGYTAALNDACYAIRALAQKEG